MRASAQCPSHGSISRGRGGFTLVEMLVVVAIIAILAALLMPALQKALAKARDLNCMNNIRQIAVTAHSYTNDNQGRMPVAMYWDAPWWPWQRYLAPYSGIAASCTPWVWEDPPAFVNVRPHNIRRGKGIFSCPSISDEEILAKDAAWGNPNGGRCTKNYKFDYGLNEHLAGITLPRVRQTGRTFAFLDMCSDNGTGQPAASGHLLTWGGCANGNHIPKTTAPYSAWPMYAGEPPRHGDKALINIAYVDGHGAAQLMPLFDHARTAVTQDSGSYFQNTGDVPNKCSDQTRKAGIWMEVKQ